MEDSIHEFDTSNYLDYIEEKVQPWSYMKFPFMKQEDSLRVTTVLVLWPDFNIVDSVPTERGIRTLW